MFRARSTVVPMLLVMGLDFWFTLAAQSDSYWQGMYTHCVEMSPPAKALLQAGPGYFAVAYLFYVSAVLLFIMKLSKSLTVIVMGVLLGHAWGSASWLPCLFSKWVGITLSEAETWYVSVGYFGFIALVCGICFRAKKPLIELPYELF